VTIATTWPIAKNGAIITATPIPNWSSGTECPPELWIQLTPEM
jgi:hypothetical protein